MTSAAESLRAAAAQGASRTASWILVLPDQLNLLLGPVSRADRHRSGIVLVESGEWLSRRPYHASR